MTIPSEYNIWFSRQWSGIYRFVHGFPPWKKDDSTIIDLTYDGTLVLVCAGGFFFVFLVWLYFGGYSVWEDVPIMESVLHTRDNGTVAWHIYLISDGFCSFFSFSPCRLVFFRFIIRSNHLWKGLKTKLRDARLCGNATCFPKRGEILLWNWFKERKKELKKRAEPIGNEIYMSSNSSIGTCM